MSFASTTKQAVWSIGRAVSIPLLPMLAALAIYRWQVEGFAGFVSRHLTQVGSDNSIRYWTFAGLLLFGVVIYGLRANQRHVYGLFETAFGQACIWEGLDPHRDPKTAGAVVIAGIYVMIRGIDNTRLGWKEQAEFRAKRAAERALATETPSLPAEEATTPKEQPTNGDENEPASS
jgi:hypothetical protein